MKTHVMRLQFVIRLYLQNMPDLLYVGLVFQMN